MSALACWPTTEFVRSVQGRQGPLAVLVAYFDESGISKNEKVALVGGAVMDSVVWARLDRPWAENLKTSRVTWFHAVDCENRWGEFEHLERPLRDSLVRALSVALAKQGPQCFGSAIYRDAWAFATDTVRTRSFDDPYFFCFELCLQQVADWSNKYAGGEPVALVFANQMEYKDRAIAIHQMYQEAKERWSSLGSLTFADPRLLVPLQAGDLLAYELYQFIKGGATYGGYSRQAFRHFETIGGTAMSLMIHDRESVSKLGLAYEVEGDG